MNPDPPFIEVYDGQAFDGAVVRAQDQARGKSAERPSQGRKVCSVEGDFGSIDIGVAGESGLRRSIDRGSVA
jgi:hypothetical protein